MTPERALELMAAAPVDIRERFSDEDVLRIIIDACAEERKAALTEAAEICCPLGLEQPGIHPVARDCCRDILALRDRA